jgi:peptidyl-tRNA hydrolase, PTH1 family
VGLGNPGPHYERTRHNVGFRVVAACAASAGVSFQKFKSHGVMATLKDPSGVIMRLAAPSSFMNRSGTPVSAMLAFHKIPPARLIVVHDELDLAPGVVRLKFGGGIAGHNGLRDIARLLGTTDFFRVRVGIGRPEGRMPPADYVLGPFGAEEEATLGDVVERACLGARTLALEGLVAAQQLIHPQS